MMDELIEDVVPHLSARSDAAPPKQPGFRGVWLRCACACAAVEAHTWVLSRAAEWSRSRSTCATTCQSIGPPQQEQLQPGIAYTEPAQSVVRQGCGLWLEQGVVNAQPRVSPQIQTDIAHHEPLGVLPGAAKAKGRADVLCLLFYSHAYLEL